MLTIIGLPIGPDAYTTCYYRALQSGGVRVIEGDFSGRSLLANRHDADYLHLHWPSFIYKDKSAIASLRKFVRFVLLLALTRLCGIRLLWTAHNLYTPDRNKIAVLDRLGRKILVSLSYRVFVHGSSAASTVTQEFPGVRGKLVIIPHGNWIGFHEDEYHARVKAQIERRPQGIRLEDRFVPNDELQYYLAACNVVVLAYADILTSGAAMLAIGLDRPATRP